MVSNGDDHRDNIGMVFVQFSTIHTDPPMSIGKSQVYYHKELGIKAEAGMIRGGNRKGSGDVWG